MPQLSMQVSEFIDNSLKALHVAETDRPEVDVYALSDGSKGMAVDGLIVYDNGCGMNHSGLERWRNRGSVPTAKAPVRLLTTCPAAAALLGRTQS